MEPRIAVIRVGYIRSRCHHFLGPPEESPFDIFPPSFVIPDCATCLAFSHNRLSPTNGPNNRPRRGMSVPHDASPSEAQRPIDAATDATVCSATAHQRAIRCSHPRSHVLRRV